MFRLVEPGLIIIILIGIILIAFFKRKNECSILEKNTLIKSNTYKK